MKTCKQCSSSFKVAQKDLSFYKKIDVPSPTLCPKCREQRRMIWRNERNLYRRKCDYSKKYVISMYDEGTIFPVYDNDIWWSDKWNPMDYGQDFDFNHLALDQIRELSHKVPRRAVDRAGESINCDYINCAGYSKNCYLIFNSAHDENCLYARGLAYSKDCIDVYFGTKSELCYECINFNNCFNVKFSQNVDQCADSTFLFNCIGCTDCFMCTNLNHKQYYICNKPYTKDEYLKRMKNYSLQSYKTLLKYKKEFNNFVLKAIHRENQNLLTENCSGDLVRNSKNCNNCFEVNDSEDCKYCDSIKYCKSSYDVFGYGYRADLLYETVTTGDTIHAISCDQCAGCSDIYYCQSCFNCDNCFGCISLKNKKYCIFNKQYIKEEYEELMSKIVEHMKLSGEWGEFFPAAMSPFAYNETRAQDYYFLSKKEVLSKGWKWKEGEDSIPDVKKIIPAKQLPDNILDIPDDILNWAIECKITKRPFKVTDLELKLYRKFGLPIPRKHPEERYQERVKFCNPHKLFNRKCDKCSSAIKTSFAPDRPEVVYCEKCYLNEVY